MPPLIACFLSAGVGKSSLLLRFADNTFSGECALGVLLGCLGFEIPFPGAGTHLPPPHVRNLAIPTAAAGRRSGRPGLEASVVGLTPSGSEKPFTGLHFGCPGSFCGPTFKKKTSQKNIAS